MKFLLSATVMLACIFPYCYADPELDSANDFVVAKQPGIAKDEIKKILTSSVSRKMKLPGKYAYSPDDVMFWAKRAKQAHKIAPVSRGDKDVKYDVIIQIGHYPRRKGRTGGQGNYVTEQEIASLVGATLIQKLDNMTVRKRKIKALLVGADDYTQFLQSKIFLSLHTDSAKVPCNLGPSIGYQKSTDSDGMHGIALALALTLGLDAEKFMNDNYTSGLSGYYAYSSFQTEKFKGLLEMSELTCQKQEEILLTRAAALAENLATAIQFALR